MSKISRLPLPLFRFTHTVSIIKIASSSQLSPISESFSSYTHLHGKWYVASQEKGGRHSSAQEY